MFWNGWFTSWNILQLIVFLVCDGEPALSKQQDHCPDSAAVFRAPLQIPLGHFDIKCLDVLLLRSPSSEEPLVFAELHFLYRFIPVKSNSIRLNVIALLSEPVMVVVKVVLNWWTYCNAYVILLCLHGWVLESKEIQCRKLSDYKMCHYTLNLCCSL